jgi:hypothetical protein
MGAHDEFDRLDPQKTLLLGARIEDLRSRIVDRNAASETILDLRSSIFDLQSSIFDLTPGAWR